MLPPSWLSQTAAIFAINVRNQAHSFRCALWNFRAQLVCAIMLPDPRGYSQHLRPARQTNEGNNTPVLNAEKLLILSRTAAQALITAGISKRQTHPPERNASPIHLESLEFGKRGSQNASLLYGWAEIWMRRSPPRPRGTLWASMEPRKLSVLD